MFLPGAWYQDLAKPTFNPPNWLFAPVWLVLYITIAISGALAWRAGANRWVVGWWALQIALNAAWTALFFGLQKPGLALIEILALLAAIVMYARVVWPVERRSSLLLIPYVLWVAFAAMLNLMIWHLNG